MPKLIRVVEAYADLISGLKITGSKELIALYKQFVFSFDTFLTIDEFCPEYHKAVIGIDAEEDLRKFAALSIQSNMVDFLMCLLEVLAYPGDLRRSSIEEKKKILERYDIFTAITIVLTERSNRLRYYLDQNSLESLSRFNSLSVSLNEPMVCQRYLNELALNLRFNISSLNKHMANNTQYPFITIDRIPKDSRRGIEKVIKLLQEAPLYHKEINYDISLYHVDAFKCLFYILYLLFYDRYFYKSKVKKNEDSPYVLNQTLMNYKVSDILLAVMPHENIFLIDCLSDDLLKNESPISRKGGTYLNSLIDFHRQPFISSN